MGFNSLLIFFSVVYISVIHAAEYKVTSQVYLDISHGKKDLGRITIGLFGDLTPNTVKNFRTIATTGINGSTYAGSKFHRVIPKFMIQGGDIQKEDGSGSISLWGKYFDDENFKVNHTGPGFVSMANAGKNTNGCQFFITTIATPWLDGVHTIFGKVVDGQDVVHKIEQVKTDTNDKPVVPVVIKKSGEIPTPSPFTVSDNPYDLSAWMKASLVPCTMSFCILGFFHWVIKKLQKVENEIEKIEKEQKCK